MTELSTTVPALAPAALEALVRRVYGIEGSTRPLAGERDQNCLVEAADGSRYVLKISNPSESPAVVDFQIAALDHIARMSPDQPVPRVVRTLAGHTHDTVALDGGVRTRVRMLSYLDGIQIRETVRTAAQRRAMGAGLAALNHALHGFTHPGAAHDLLWNVATAHRLNEQLDSLVDLVDDKRRVLAQAFMARFTTHVLPRLASLRSQVIHNDYHLYNVLVAPEDQARIVGIIDFGDMVYAPLVGEVATAAAFHMAGSTDPFEGPAQFVAAYHAVLPLNGAEQEVVADLLATRHLITALISEWRAARYPENRAYIMRHNPAAWEGLAQMADLSRDTARDRLLAGVHVHVQTGATL
jgi:hydroxylysine kinase